MPQKQILSTIRGFNILQRERPEDFIATSSYLSPKFPIVIMEAKRIESGKAIGTRVAQAYVIISKITDHSNPLPTICSIFFQRNCNNNTNIAMEKVSSQGPK